MMAERHFFCAVCEKNYDFSSKYQRHLASSGHRTLEEIQKLHPPSTSTDTLIETTTDSTIDSGVSGTFEQNDVDVSNSV